MYMERDKENFIKDFSFVDLVESNLKEAVQEIRDYIEKPSKKITQEKGNLLVNIG
jgi:hypothetical protein